MWLINKFKPTVAGVTAKFDNMVAQLEAIEQKSFSKLSFHRAMVEAHGLEMAAAQRISAKIKELVA